MAHGDPSACPLIGLWVFGSISSPHHVASGLHLSQCPGGRESSSWAPFCNCIL